MEMSRYEWMDEAFERGYQLGLAHGSKNSGLTWVMADKAKPNDGTDVVIARRLTKRQAKKVAKHPERYAVSYSLSIGHYFDEDSANEYFGRDGYWFPELVAVGDWDLYAWEDVLAWAYLNPPDLGEKTKGD